MKVKIFEGRIYSVIKQSEDDNPRFIQKKLMDFTKTMENSKRL